MLMSCTLYLGSWAAMGQLGLGDVSSSVNQYKRGMVYKCFLISLSHLNQLYLVNNLTL